jgi:ornithine cyclodeaminase/alanine dehydrogenase-like protein (mu-crystallin family)
LETLFLGAEDVSELLSMKECIDVMDKTFRQITKGEAGFPPREALPLKDGRGVLGLMPGFLHSEGMFGLKATSVFPRNLGTKFESHQGAVLLFEATNGSLLCVVDAGEVTRIRTAAASGAATRALARENVEELAIIGSGTQASSHLEAMLAVRPTISRVRVFSRTKANAKRFAERESKSAGVDVQVADSPSEAARQADLICTVTNSTAPVLLGAWLGPGTHVNAVGASRPPARELDTEAVVKSRFFVDSRQSAALEADDYRVPLKEGRVGEGFIVGEVGDVLEHRVRGRVTESDITVFKSLGLAVEDLAAANYAYHRAQVAGVGRRIDFGSGRRT